MSGPVVLCILDGWGKRSERDANAIALAETPNWNRMIRQWPTGQLNCSGTDVGLPEGQMGNSEVGHMNLGAGRIVWQDLPRINNAIADGSMAKSPELSEFIAKLKASGGTCHLAGLVSPGGVHSLDDHVVALASIIADAGVPVNIHAFLDGRDTPPRSAGGDVKKLTEQIARLPNVFLATLCGRYFAMDRDNRWDRVVQCYNLLTSGAGVPYDDPLMAIQKSYDENVTDEFVKPVSLNGYAGMADGDGLLIANFRSDRVREILAALIDPGFNGFERAQTVKFAALLGMVSYSDELDKLCGAIFAPDVLSGTLGEAVANAGMKQLRLAETEKYPHVTFFFNGRSEPPLAGEERILVPSPKVATYDLQPEMSAPEVTEHLVEAIRNRRVDMIIVNYANGDMVGHTGSLDAAIAAVECLDSCLGKVEQAIVDVGGTMLVTADHGNCEMMIDPETGGPHTAHTLNPVPTVLVNHPDKNAKLNNGRLADVAPTLLEILGHDLPDEMTGRSLICHAT
ncbi:MAG: 2,3-bisphosphoglycerate-independent phosphoglycerate mutase [Hyphomicrobiaceae bacterium]